MAPKLRRPAAAKPVAKPAPRRGAGVHLGLRRPAGEAEPREAVSGDWDEEEKFIGGVWGKEPCWWLRESIGALLANYVGWSRTC